MIKVNDFDFTFLELEVVKKKKNIQKGYISIKEVCDNISYPHNMFPWIMPDNSFITDAGGNDMLPNPELYKDSLSEAKEIIIEKYTKLFEL